jgi:hypothetical protein
MEHAFQSYFAAMEKKAVRAFYVKQSEDEAVIYRVFRKELNNFERVYKFIQRT